MTQRNGLIGLVLLAILFPFMLGQNQYVLHVITLGFIWTIAVYGMNIIAGYTGYLSLAHAGFFAIGAYSVGLLSVKAGIGFWLALPLALMITTMAGFLIGLIALRTEGHFFAIYTLIVGYIIYLLIDKWDSLTGGVRGLIGIPAPDPIGPISFNSGLSMYYLVLFFLIVSIFLAVRIVHSLTGRTYIAIRNSEELAQTLGISTMKQKLISFVVSSFFAGLAGGLYASFTQFIGPDIAYTTAVFDMLMYLLVGGIGTLAGPLVGTLTIVWLTQQLQFLQELRMLIFGPILVLLIIFYPHGLVGGYMMWKQKRILKKKKKQKNSIDYTGHTGETHQRVKEG
ncbi:branched-chain amino acid ABC transporter permease [Alteribacillus sp. JSM 102045]|uniref:branched-chain amino acid ABC transporter permease n=1 Tax=Alteribacillus sp. JSM 102045 TaxID=1562101 RepID=UPI0035BFED57